MKKITKKSTFATILLIFAVTFIFILDYFKRQQQGDEDRHLAVNYLRKTAELEHMLRERVLEAHSFKFQNYDSIVEVTTMSQDICVTLTSSSRMSQIFSDDQKIEDNVNDYCRLNREVLAATEEFKSKNSILVNSIKYFPILIESLPSQKTKFEALDLYNRILEFCLQPTPAKFADLESEIVKIRRNSLLGQDRGKADSLLKHAELVIHTATVRQELEGKILAPTVEIAIANLANAYVTATDRRENSSKIFKGGIVIFSAALLMSLLILLYRLQESKDSLTELNRDLEAKVLHRTKDLTKALADLETQQQILAHSTKMSALGEMAGGIAHEINTPLAAISLKAESMIFSEVVTHDGEKGLEEIIQIVAKLAKIVSGLRNFSRDGKNETFSSVSMTQIVHDTLILCSQKFKNNGVRLDVHLDDALFIQCIPEQISQVLLNLLNNAYDAIQPLENKWVSITTFSEDGQICIRVVDSGDGIPLRIQEKLMQPFFTTKEVGKGTGIGLSISSGIIQKHGGKLCYNAQGSNTTFDIHLPALPAQKVAA